VTLSAQQGHAEAQSNLGYAYLYGRGVARDYHTALDWFRKAAAQNQPNAEYESADPQALLQLMTSLLALAAHSCNRERRYARSSEKPRGGLGHRSKDDVRIEAGHIIRKGM